MEFLREVNHFYFQMSLHELRLMHTKGEFGGLSYNSLLYLDVISQREQCTVSTLAQLLHITQPAVTAKVNELVRQGLLEKKQSETDGRVHYLQVCEKYSHMIDVYDTIFAGIGKAMEQKYTPAQMTLFGEMMRMVSDCDWS